MTARVVAIVFVLTVLFFTVGWWKNEKDSCERQAGVRAAIMTVADGAQTARAASAERDLAKGDMAAYKVDHQAALEYAKAKRQSAPLDCGGAFPDTK